MYPDLGIFWARVPESILGSCHAIENILGISCDGMITILCFNDVSQVSAGVVCRQDPNYDPNYKNAQQKLNIFNWGEIPTKI